MNTRILRSQKGNFKVQYKWLCFWLDFCDNNADGHVPLIFTSFNKALEFASKSAKDNWHVIGYIDSEGYTPGN